MHHIPHLDYFSYNVLWEAGQFKYLSSTPFALGIETKFRKYKDEGDTVPAFQETKVQLKETHMQK